jgi:hypothetical protein
MPETSLQELKQAEDLWRKLNPHPTGSYAWYGWSMEFTIDNGQVLAKPDSVSEQNSFSDFDWGAFGQLRKDPKY